MPMEGGSLRRTALGDMTLSMMNGPYCQNPGSQFPFQPWWLIIMSSLSHDHYGRLPISLLMIQHPVLALNNYPHHNPETPHDGCETGCYNNHSITRAGIMADREEVEVTTKKLRQWNVLSAQSTANPNSITQHSLCEWDHDIYHWVNIPMEPQSWQHKIIWSTQESQCTKAYRGQELLKPLLETSIMDLGADLLVLHYYSRSLHQQDDSISSSALDHRLS